MKFVVGVPTHDSEVAYPPVVLRGHDHQNKLFEVTLSPRQALMLRRALLDALDHEMFLDFWASFSLEDLPGNYHE